MIDGVFRLTAFFPRGVMRVTIADLLNTSHGRVAQTAVRIRSA